MNDRSSVNEQQTHVSRELAVGKQQALRLAEDCTAALGKINLCGLADLLHAIEIGDRDRELLPRPNEMQARAQLNLFVNPTR